MKHPLILASALFAMLFALPAFALTLDQARNSGAIAEQLDGYVAVLKASPDVNALAADINTKRKQEYARISKENGQPIDIVAKLAAQQVINKLPAGSLYQSPDNGWKKK
jgi:uncharacterized protein YdbL (DUF1318 family)